MKLTGEALVAYVPKWCDAMRAAAPELNGLDAQLGDGDLGTTLENCANKVATDCPELSGDLESDLSRVSKTLMSTAGSSFGTLLAVAVRATSKQIKQKPDASVVELLEGVISTLASRGGARLGDKTVLDALEAIRTSVSNASSGETFSKIALGACDQALGEFRNQPNKIGRARMFPEKSVGMDDPGMIALKRMIEAI